MSNINRPRTGKTIFSICIFLICSFNSLSTLSHDRAGILTFEEFIHENTFVSKSDNSIMVDAHCHRKYDDDGEKRYFEVLFSTKGGHWFDINQHNDGSHSLTLWGWYNTVALKSGNVTAIYHGKPWATRFNMNVALELVNSIISTGEFELYLEPNPFRYGGFMLGEESRKKYGFKKVKDFQKHVVGLNNPAKVGKCFKNP